MTERMLQFIIPCAFDVLPSPMRSKEASAILLAIGLQESKFMDRRQRPDGPALGFWQFEKAGIAGVMAHKSTREVLKAALSELRYGHLVNSHIKLHHVCEHNDVVAAVFARLLLWTLPAALPASTESAKAWEQYMDAWRPGKPRPEAWQPNFREAWFFVKGEQLT